MKKVLNETKKFIVKHGAALAACAFAFVTIAANSPCFFPYYEPEEPDGIENYKKFNK